MSSKIEVSRELAERLLNPTHLYEAEDELRAILAAPVVEHQPYPDAYRHRMIMDYGYQERLTDDKDNPFGKRDVDYDKAFTVTCEPLFAAPPELAELQATIDQLRIDLSNQTELTNQANYHKAQRTEALNDEIARLTAENERLNKQLCVCPSCHGQGELFAGSHSYQGQWQPPEPDTDKCGECDGDGVIGTPVDLAAALAEIEWLKAGQGEPVAYGMASELVRIQKRPSQGHMVYGSPNGAYGIALYTSQPAPVSVVLPEPLPRDPGYFFDLDLNDKLDDREAKGWNACLDKVKELNQ